MAQVLSQDEINQLLTAIDTDDSKQKGITLTADGRKIKIYDFKRPYKFTREHIKAISFVHDTFASLACIGLSAKLRSLVHVHVAFIDQLTYCDFIRSIPTPTTLAILNMTPLKGYAIMNIDLAVTFSIIDRICGGTGKETKAQHELTDIEVSIMENVIVCMLDNLRVAWNHGLEIDLHPRLVQIDTNPQFAPIIPPNEMVAWVTLEVKLDDVESIIDICIPYSTIEPIKDKLSIWHKEGQNNTLLRLSTKSEITRREDVPVALTAEVLRRDYPVKEILKWDTETLILPLRPHRPGYCYLRLGDRRVWQCQILPDSKWFSKRITVVNYAEKPFGTDGNDMKMNKANPPVKDALSDATMKVSVELGTTLKTVKEVYAMGEGTTVELDKLPGEPLDIMANGVLIAYGEAVVIEENFGIKITEIIGT